MTQVAVCPRCEGERKVRNARSGRMEDCPTCDGSGVKWRDVPAEEGELASEGEARDLTYRR